ncbi:MAG: hypothetical protein HUU37_06900, partial [Bdellovibrionales bacterium]|nr:hypothetical protein [Bdellovibrionales bacterium]
PLRVVIGLHKAAPLAFFWALIILFFIGTAAPALGGSIDLAPTQEKIAWDILKSFVDKKRNPDAIIRHIREPGYVQHNVKMGDGRSGYLAARSNLPDGLYVNRILTFSDDNHVVVHVEYPRTLGIDIYRFEGTEAVEHWDCIFMKPIGRSSNTVPLLGWGVEAEDLDKTAENKKLIADLTSRNLGAASTEHVDRCIDTNFLPQNTWLRMVKAIHEWRTGIVYRKTHKILGKGSLVMTLREGSIGGTPTAFCDIFRLKNSRVLERWSVRDTIPPREYWKNDNGKF